jgi:alpha/beta superfamily hydrolase
MAGFSCLRSSVREEKVSIPCGTFHLEGFLGFQEALSGKGGVICCHPHPLYGGDMDNSVVAAGIEAASREGLSTLRFNFRGVGESGGSYGEGIEERKDVKAVIDYFTARLKNDGTPMIVFGYSFGAWAGMPVAVENPRIKGMVAVSPPLDLYDFGFLKGCRKKKLLIAGNQDDYCLAARLQELHGLLDEPKSLTIIPGADHFYSFHNSELIKPLREFFGAF